MSREFDDNIELPGFANFRFVDLNEGQFFTERPQGRINLYIDNKSASFVHDAFLNEENAIDLIMNESQKYHEIVTNELSKLKISEPHLAIDQQYAFCSISVNYPDKTDIHAPLSLTFLSLNGHLVGIKMQGLEVLDIQYNHEPFKVSYTFK